MLIGYVMVFVGMLLIGYDLGPSLLYLPIVLLLMTVFVTGYVLFLSAVTVYIRDLQYLINSLSMVFFFMTPLYFMMSDVSGILANLIALNPFAYYVQAYQQILYFGTIPDFHIMMMCALMPVISLVIGIVVFRRLRRGFAERL
jgi:ABC-2 type transport system permease protein